MVATIPNKTSPYTGNFASDTNKGAVLKDLDSRVTALETAIDTVTAFTLADAVAKTIRTIAVPDLSNKGGWIEYLVKATDGVDTQTVKGRVQWAATAKAGTVSAGLGTPGQVAAASAGTLAVSFSSVLTANQLVIQITVDSSLVVTAESVDITFQDLS